MHNVPVEKTWFDKKKDRSRVYCLQLLKPTGVRRVYVLWIAVYSSCSLNSKISFNESSEDSQEINNECSENAYQGEEITIK